MIAPEIHKAVHERIACPYCAEMIQPLATVCPFCRGPLINGRAVHPAHESRLKNRSRKSHVPDKSFVSSAVIVALLYLLCWPVSLVLNIVWYNEAKDLERTTGREPDGKGCLLATLVVGIILAVLSVIGIMAKASRM
jgi:hypothetical protein